MSAVAEELLICKECGGQMYSLPGSIRPIFVCPDCGFSTDEEYIQQQEAMKQPSEDKPMLIKNLFNDYFMKKYTSFPCLADFMRSCKFFKQLDCEITYEDISCVPKRKLDKYIQKNTVFQTFNQMFEKAVSLYLRM